MTREEASKTLTQYIDYDAETPDYYEMEKACKVAIEALSAEPCREADDYENEIADLHNRLDIAEYDKERLREEVTALEEKLKSLSVEPCEDTISFPKGTLKKRGKGYVVYNPEWLKENWQTELKVMGVECVDAISRAWLKEAIHNFYYGLKHTPTEEDIQAYIDAAPSVTPKPKMGRWVAKENPMPFEYPYSCSQCTMSFFFKMPFCPNCGAKMESEGTE